MNFLFAAVALAPGLQASTDVPFRIGEDAIIVDAFVNKRKLSLMFDTGFSGAVVATGNVNLGKPTGAVRLRDFVGEFEAPTVKITDFKLGSVTLPTNDMEVVQTPGADYSFSYNTHVDGILGFGAVCHNTLEINFQNSKFVLHPSSFDITKRTPDNVKTFLLKLLPAGNQSLELEVMTSDNKRLTMALDTGNAFFATTHRDVLERVGMWQVGKDPKFVRSSFVASGEVPSWSKTMKGMKIFGVPVPESTWSIIDLPSGTAESDGTIGFGFLKNFNITIDFDRRRIWMENYTGRFSEEPVADIGLSAAEDRNSKRIRVVRVAPDGPAAKADVRRGDTVLSIDGVDELKMGWRRLNKMLEGPKGSKVNLAISRNGNVMRKEIERDFLIND